MTSLDTRLDAEEPKTTALQTLTEGHTDDIASNTANILTKQATITTATDLETNSITTNNLEVNGGVNIDTKTYFDTIVIRRPTGLTGRVDDFAINLKELQCWVNGVNIMIDNGLTSYYTEWTDKETDIGFFPNSPVSNIYNNIIESDYGTATVDSREDIALIIKNIPYTNINNIQALVLYNRSSNPWALRAIGLAIELYNSINDPDLTEVLATTDVITSGENIYRFDFPSISTYTEFVGANSITNIVSDTFAETEDAIFTDYAFEITGDVVASGSITAGSVIVGSTNVITELTSLDTLTASHTEDLATNTANILTKQATITTSTDLTPNSITTNNLEVNKSVDIDTSKYFDTIVIRRPTGTSGIEGDFFISLRELQVWIDEVNLLQTEGITAIFIDWTGDKITAIPERDPNGGVSYDAINLFNESFTSPNDVESKENQSDSNTAVIIRNIPLSLIETIQAIVLYNRNDADNESTIGLAIELYTHADAI